MRQKWQKIKTAVLGKKYRLSVVVAGGFLMLKLNKTYRKKNQQANVLSFALSGEEGEVFINKKFMADKHYSDFLFLHSILHLKGFAHGKQMEKEENALAERFKINV